MLSIISELVLSLRKINKISLVIPQEFEDLEYEEKENFILFIQEQYEEFKNLNDINTNNYENREILDNNNSSNNTSKNDETIKQTKISEKKEVETETKIINENEKNSIKINEENAFKKIEKEENKTPLIKPRKNYLSWILGAGITGLIGIGLFYMISKKKY